MAAHLAGRQKENIMTNQNAPPRGGKRALIAVLIAANLVMLVIGVLTIPPNLKAAAGGNTPAPRAEQTAPVSTDEPGTVDRGDNTPASTDAPVSTDAPAPENLSTTERPDLGDFLWYTEDVLYNGAPSDAAAITSLDMLTGGWKALIIYDPDNSMDSNAYEFLNIALAGTADDLSLTLDWYQIFWANEGESFDETDMEDGAYSGKWENGGLWASGAGTIRLTRFYEQNGKQYAVGTMDTPDGTPALVALVRP